LSLPQDHLLKIVKNLKIMLILHRLLIIPMIPTDSTFRFSARGHEQEGWISMCPQIPEQCIQTTVTGLNFIIFVKKP
jgi:hypothetical protein